MGVSMEYPEPLGGGYANIRYGYVFSNGKIDRESRLGVNIGIYIYNSVVYGYTSTPPVKGVVVVIYTLLHCLFLFYRVFVLDIFVCRLFSLRFKILT